MFPGTHLGNNTSPEKKGLVRVGGGGGWGMSFVRLYKL